VAHTAREDLNNNLVTLRILPVDRHLLPNVNILFGSIQDRSHLLQFSVLLRERVGGERFRRDKGHVYDSRVERCVWEWDSENK
jgi:hypothetical protein